MKDDCKRNLMRIEKLEEQARCLASGHFFTLRQLYFSKEPDLLDCTFKCIYCEMSYCKRSDNFTDEEKAMLPKVPKLFYDAGGF